MDRLNNEPRAEPLTVGEQIQQDIGEAGNARDRAVAAIRERMEAAYIGGASQEELWARLTYLFVCVLQ